MDTCRGKFPGGYPRVPSDPTHSDTFDYNDDMTRASCSAGRGARHKGLQTGCDPSGNTQI